MVFTEQTKIGYIWASPEGRSILLNYAPELKDSPYLSFLKRKRLVDLVGTNQALNRSNDWLVALVKELVHVSFEREEEKECIAVANYETDSVLSSSAKVNSPESVEKWNIFELEIYGPSHGNPFVDVVIGAQFSMEGQRVDIEGFYDGDGKYKVRFMPEKEGKWTYCTKSNAHSMDGIEGSFTCTPAVGDNHGPVQVADTFHFSYKDGTRYLPFGTTCYAWTHQSRELEEQTLSTLSTSPFNKVRMCVFPKSYLFNNNEPLYSPFEGSSQDGWDFTRFNPEFFQHLEERIGDLRNLGIEADLILFHPYDRWGFSEMSRLVDKRYLNYITARLSAYRNVWWSLANEYDLMWAKEEDDWEYIAEIVKKNDPYDHLISIHNCFAFYDYNKPWVSHCSVQRIDVYRTAENTDEWRRNWNKPIVIDECAYEGNIDMGWGNITGEEMVRRFWEGAVRGGYVGHGETYLHPTDVLWWSKGGELYGTSPERIRFLHHILEQGPTGILNPLQSEWDVPTAGISDKYYLYYYGFNRPSYRNFTMTPGIGYKVDVIDTWNMTVEEQDGVYEGNFRIELPGRQYMAIRLSKV